MFGRTRVLVLQSEAFFTDPRPSYERVLDFLGAPVWLPYEFPRVSISPSHAVAATTRRQLIGAFRASNERLFAMIDERFPWQ